MNKDKTCKTCKSFQVCPIRNRLCVFDGKGADCWRPRGRKHRNQPVEMDGYKFDSKVERDEYFRLKLMRDAGRIRSLKVHWIFALFAWVCETRKAQEIGEFTPDFYYYDINEHREVINEVKNPNDRKDAAYRLRLKIFRVNYSKIKIVEAVYGAKGRRTETTY